MSASNTPLTIPTIVHLARLIDARGKSARYLRDPESDTVLHVVIREVGPFDGETNTGAQDVRDQFVRLSGTMEHWIPVSEAVAALAGGRLAITG